MKLSETYYKLGDIVNILATKKGYLALSKKSTHAVEATVIGRYKNHHDTVLLGWKKKPKLAQYGISVIGGGLNVLVDAYELVDNIKDFTHYYATRASYLFVPDQVDNFFSVQSVLKRGPYKFILAKDVQIGDLITWNMKTGLNYGEVKDITEYEDPRGLPILLLDMEVFDNTGCKVFKNGCPLPSDIEVLLLKRNG